MQVAERGRHLLSDGGDPLRSIKVGLRGALRGIQRLGRLSGI